MHLDMHALPAALQRRVTTPHLLTRHLHEPLRDRVSGIPQFLGGLHAPQGGPDQGLVPDEQRWGHPQEGAADVDVHLPGGCNSRGL